MLINHLLLKIRLIKVISKEKKYFAIDLFFFLDISITVTCFGSGHCPGSLMLLFEGSHSTILYTGDFRFYSHQSNRHRIILSKKLIDTLYIDMTFFEPTIRQLPEREQACEKLIQFIQQNETNHFYLKTSARVGYEYIYTKLHQHLGVFIHVNPEQYQLYNCLPQVQQALTTDGSRTRIHACWPRCVHTKSSIKVIIIRSLLFSMILLLFRLFFLYFGLLYNSSNNLNLLLFKYLTIIIVFVILYIHPIMKFVHLLNKYLLLVYIQSLYLIE
jgi:hypothetical protein